MEEQLLAAEIRRLSVAARISLAQDIWDGIAQEQESLSMTDAQREELDRRINACRVSPAEGTSWEAIKKKLKAPK